MGEMTIMEFFKWFIGLIFILVIMAIATFYYQVGQTNRFSSFVSSEIERGRLEPVKAKDGTWTLDFSDEADKSIKEENDSYYGGRYTVTITSEHPDKTATYGDQVSYKIKGEYKVMFSDSLFNGLATFDNSTDGSSVIQVRGI